MSRRGKVLILGLTFAVLIAAAWYLVVLVKDLMTPSVGAAPQPECVLTEYSTTSEPAAAVTPLATIALADTTVAAGTGSTVSSMSLSAVQLQHASTINAVGLQRGLSDQARVIALATALQESSLRNLPNGDLDSVGLFQQRPSQGWGTATEISDPVYAAGKFYDALLEVRGWAAMSLTEAAQAVQYSAYPDAYAKWERAAAQLESGLSDLPYPRVSCRAGATPPTADAPTRAELNGAESGSTSLRTVLAAAEAELGGLSVSEISADGVTATVSITLPDRTDEQAAAALAFWTVAHATGSNVAAVAAADYEWTDHSWSPGHPLRPAGQVRITVTGPAG